MFEIHSHIRNTITPPSEVPLMINAANAVVVTSEREGFGLACLEALAAKRTELT